MFPANTMGILSLFVRSCAIKVRIIFSSNSYLLPSQVRRMFNKADKNKDGKLTPEEWRQVLNSSGVPTSMYTHALLFIFFVFCVRLAHSVSGSGRRSRISSRGWIEILTVD